MIKKKKCKNSSYLQSDGRNGLLDPQCWKLRPRVRRRWGRGSLQSWAASSPPAWGSYPWVSAGSWGRQRSGGRVEASRSWLQPSFRAEAGVCEALFACARTQARVCVWKKSVRSRERRTGGGCHRRSLWEEKSEDAAAASSSSSSLWLDSTVCSVSWCLLLFLFPCSPWSRREEKNPVFCSKQMTETKSVLFAHSLKLMKKHQILRNIKRFNSWT